MPFRRICQALILTGTLNALSAGTCRAQEPTDPGTFLHRAEVQRQYREHQETWGTDTNRLVRMGLMADRATHRIELEAEMTGIGPEEPLEYVLIADTSGKNYEALAVSHARPSDVHAALQFIGLPEGQSFDPAEHRFWPVGERVRITVQWDEETPEGSRPRSAPIENLVMDKPSGQAMAPDGWVFTGAPVEPAPGGTNRVYTADQGDPGSIISLYNETYTVLDLPRQAAKGQVYETQFPHPDISFTAGQRVTLVMEPADPPGFRRVSHQVLKISPRAGQTGTEPDDLLFALHTPDGQPTSRGDRLEDVLTALAGLLQDGREPHLSVDLDDRLSLAAAKTICRFLRESEDSGSLRISPPLPGRWYYQAYLPNPAFRERSMRPSQPWEWHLLRHGDAWQVQRIDVHENWSTDGSEPELQVLPLPMQSPEEAAQALLADDRPLRVLLVFAPPDATCGELRQFLSPLREKFHTLYIFEPLDSTPSSPGEGP